MKKVRVFILFLTLVLPLSGCRFFRREKELFKEPSPSVLPVKKNTLKFSEDNPYVYLVPRSDGHALNLYASRFGEEKHLEYELTYKSGAQLQGAIGRFAFEGESVGPEEILLGTCSKGVCKYDEGVEEGKLMLKFLYKDIREEKVWESDFHLQSIGAGGGKISSKDGKFNLDIPSGSVDRSTYVLTMPLLSLPEKLGKDIIGSPYGVFTPTPSKLSKDLVVSFLFFTLPDDFENLAIFGWDGEKWVEYETQADAAGRKLAAEVNRFTSFVVAKKS